MIEREMAVEDAVAAAADAAPWLAGTDPSTRARLLEAVAAALDDAGDDLVPLAVTETRLGVDRLRGELGRMTGQLRHLAAVVRDGAFLGVTLDSALPDTVPPRPDLRLMRVPVGPVAVFAASNFPFAFSVLGVDTAAALAAGCPAVVKPNPGHPRLSGRVAGIAQGALVGAGAPTGLVTLVSTEIEAGIGLVEDERIQAVGFTGSARAGLALARIAAERARPIPFYGELGSVNPVFVTRAAVAQDAAGIAAGFVASFTLGAGQFCTKPGLLIAPRDAALRAALRSAAGEVPAQRMLTDGIREAYERGVRERQRMPELEVVVSGGWDERTDAVTPSLFAVPAAGLLQRPELLEECFGPESILVEYADDSEMLAIADALPGLLAAGIHAVGGEEILPELAPRLVARAGRVLWGGWPTGVAVTWAMHHGGPPPASTNAATTSVGAHAIDRFTRPVTWQSWPADLLPPALRDDNPWQLPRRVDGVMQLPEPPA